MYVLLLVLLLCLRVFKCNVTFGDSYVEVEFKLYWLRCGEIIICARREVEIQAAIKNTLRLEINYNC